MKHTHPFLWKQHNDAVQRLAVPAALLAGMDIFWSDSPPRFVLVGRGRIGFVTPQFGGPEATVEALLKLTASLIAQSQAPLTIEIPRTVVMRGELVNNIKPA